MIQHYKNLIKYYLFTTDHGYTLWIHFYIGRIPKIYIISTSSDGQFASRGAHRVHRRNFDNVMLSYHAKFWNELKSRFYPLLCHRY